MSMDIKQLLESPEGKNKLKRAVLLVLNESSEFREETANFLVESWEMTKKL